MLGFCGVFQTSSRPTQYPSRVDVAAVACRLQVSARKPQSSLKHCLQAVWVDPICGDGTCEAPFEFAAFSRFGCKADCGRLSDIQNLTSAQVRVGCVHVEAACEDLGVERTQQRVAEVQPMCSSSRCGMSYVPVCCDVLCCCRWTSTGTFHTQLRHYQQRCVHRHIMCPAVVKCHCVHAAAQTAVKLLLRPAQYCCYRQSPLPWSLLSQQ